MIHIYSLGLEKTFPNFVRIITEKSKEIRYSDAHQGAYNLMVANKVSCFKFIVETFSVDLTKGNFYDFMSNRSREKIALFVIKRQPELMRDRTISDKFFQRNTSTISKRMLSLGYVPDLQTMERAYTSSSLVNLELILKNGYVNPAQVMKLVPSWKRSYQKGSYFESNSDKMVKKYFLKDLKKI
jgi:hypothetical protein